MSLDHPANLAAPADRVCLARLDSLVVLHQSVTRRRHRRAETAHLDLLATLALLESLATLGHLVSLADLETTALQALLAHRDHLATRATLARLAHQVPLAAPL